MKQLTYLFILLLAAIFTGSACNDPESLPSTPEIKYKSVEKITNISGKDSLIRLTFSYLDGDGDLGLSATDTMPPFNYTPFNKFYNNIFIDYFEMKGSKFVPVTIPFTNDTVRFLYRMDVLTPDGKNKAIKGDISIVMDLTPYDVKPQVIKFGIQIADRQLHLSNWVETPAILMNF